MSWLRKLYDWVLTLADSAYGTITLFIVSFTESSFLPIPADPLLIALGLGKTKRAFYYAFICTIASVMGGIFGYLIGYFLWCNHSPPDFSGLAMLFFNVVQAFTEDLFEKVRIQYEAYNFFVIFMAAFTPIPYKVFSISAGAFYVNLSTFIIASILGRGLRFYMVSALVWFFGPGVKRIMDKYFNWFIIILTIVFTLSYFLIGYIF